MTVGLSVLEMIKEYFTSLSWIPICFVGVLYSYWRMTAENKKKTRIVGIILIVCFFNDLIKMLFDKIFKEGVFYRFLWMLPLTIIVAYMITDICTRKDSKLYLIIVFTIGLICILTFSENWIGRTDNLNPDNVFLLSNETQYISWVIAEDTDEDRVSVVLPFKYELELRLLDPRYVTAISRKAYISYYNKGVSDRYETEDVLIQLVNEGIQTDVERMRQALIERDAQYLIIDNCFGLNDYLNEVGATLIGSYNSTCVYRIDRIDSAIDINSANLNVTNIYDDNSVLNDLLQNGYLTNVNRLHITIPDMTDSYTYCVWNDTHLWAIEDDPDVLEEQKENVTSRRNELCTNEYGIQSQMAFEKLMENIDFLDVDGLILNADIIDQMSVENLIYVKENLESISTPYMYLRSDHDVACTWTTVDKNVVNSMASEMNLNQDIYIMEEKEFIILGVNKSYKNITEAALEEIKEIFLRGKPIIIVTHVPYDSVVDRDFANRVEVARGNKLLWGSDCYYVPDENMQAYLDMIYDENTPVVAVVSAHLHDYYMVSLTNQVTEYVLGPGCKGNITIMTIGPE